MDSNFYAIKDQHGNWLVDAGDATAGTWHYDINRAWLMDTISMAIAWYEIFPDSTMHLVRRECRIRELNEVR